MTNLILYTTEDGRSQIKLRAKDQSVWLTQRDMAQLFDVSTDNVGLHLKNVFEDGELLREATTEESSVVQTEGGREVKRPVTLYNLDAILAVGYRVRSPRGVQFRRWASTVLKEYLIKGFVMDDDRLKNPDGRLKPLPWALAPTGLRRPRPQSVRRRLRHAAATGGAAWFAAGRRCVAHPAHRHRTAFFLAGPVLIIPQCPLKRPPPPDLS